MYYVLGKERQAGEKNGSYHVYDITMEQKTSAKTVSALMDFDKGTTPAGEPSKMAYKVIETDGKEFFDNWFATFDIFKDLKAAKEKGELRDGCAIDFHEKNDKSDIIDAVDNIRSVIRDTERINGILSFLTTDFFEFDLERKGARYIAQHAKEFLEMISDTLQNASDTLCEACKLIDK